MAKSSILGCGLALTIAGAASAMPITPPIADEAPIQRVAGGCGPFYHRNPLGYCVANGFYGGFRRLPPPCPRFYHRDPDPARPICYPNV